MLALGHSELMTQHQDLSVLPPRLTTRQTQQRHSPGSNQEDQLQAHKPTIIARPTRPEPASHMPDTRPSRRCPEASAQVAQVFGTHRFMLWVAVAAWAVVAVAFLAQFARRSGDPASGAPTASAGATTTAP
jgi:hypothetical protein